MEAVSLPYNARVLYQPLPTLAHNAEYNGHNAWKKWYMIIDRYSIDNYRWEGTYVAFSSHARMHMNEFNLNAIEIIDMLENPVPCPSGRRVKRECIEKCSNKHHRVYRIVLCEDYSRDVKEDCWCVKNVKPV